MSAPLLLTCRQFTLLSTDYLEGRLGSLRRVQAWFHLSWCPRCRAYLRQMRQTIALLGRLARRESPQGVRGELRRRYRERYGRGPGS